MAVLTLRGAVERRPATIRLLGSDIVVTDLRAPRVTRFLDLLEGRTRVTGVLLPLDLYVELSLIGFEKGASASAVVRTDDAGRFSLALDFGDVEGLAPLAVFRASATAYLPFDRQEPFSISGLIPANAIEGPGNADERIYNAAQAAVADVRIPVDTRGMRRSPLTLGPMPGEAPTRPFRDMADVTVELRGLDDRALFGVAPAPGDDNARTVDLVHVADLPGFYLRVRRGPLPDVLADTENTLGRSRAQPPRSGRLQPERPVIVRVAEDVGIGTISDGVPEEMAIEGTPFVVRDVDLDFVANGDGANRVLRIRADVGLGGADDDGNVFMLLRVGEFTGRYVLDARVRALGPFDDAEVDDVLVVTPLTPTYDLFSGTDVDEAIAGSLFGLEPALAGLVAERITPRLRANFAERIRRAIDERRAEVEERNPDFPVTIASIFGTLFLQPEPLVVTADEARFRARVGLWSEDLDVLAGGLDCPANALAFAAPRSRVRPAARAVQRLLKGEGRADWLALFDRHREELGALVREDPATARALGALVARTHGALRGVRPGLTADEVARARELAGRWLPRMSEPLRARLTPALERLGDAVGQGPDALRRVVFGEHPGTPAREDTGSEEAPPGTPPPEAAS